MNCKYVKDGVEYNDTNDLVLEFLTQTQELSANSIFSSEQIKDSIKSKIELGIVSKEAYQDSDYETIYDFITKPHPEFKLIPELDGIDRLAPEFISENRIKEYIKSNIDNHSVTTITEEDIKNLSKYYTLVENEVSSLDKNTVYSLLKELNEIIEIEEGTLKFSQMMHAILSLDLNDESARGLFEQFYKDNPNIFGEGNEKEWWYKITEIANTIWNNTSGEIITDVRLLSNSANYAAKGKIDLITVTDSGKVNIYQIKISKNDFSDWDTAKKLSVDWELSLKRQLLGQHINIDNIGLYVIPISIPKLGNPNEVKIGEFQNRATIRVSGAAPGSKLSIVSEIMFPRKIVTKYDPNRLTRIKSELGQLFFEDYETKTDDEGETDFDAFMASREKAYNRTVKPGQPGVWTFFNKFKDIEGVEYGNVKSEDKAEFEEKVRKYIDHVKRIENVNLSIIKNATQTAIDQGTPIKTSEISKKLDLMLNRLLQPFLNGDWDVVDTIPEATSMGIMILKNKKTHSIEIINISTNQSKVRSKIAGYSKGEIELIKVMYLVNEFRNELFPTNMYKLGNIISINPIKGEPDSKPATVVMEWFRDRSFKQGFSNDFIKLLDSDISTVQDLSIQSLFGVVSSYRGQHEGKIEEVFDELGEAHISDIKKENLLAVRSKFLKLFPQYKEKEISAKLNFDDQLEVIFSLLNVAIIAQDGFTLTGDYADLTNHSLGAENFKTLLYSLFRQDSPDYDKLGNKITGIMGGLSWIAPNFNPSRDLRRIAGLAATGNSVTGERMVKANDAIRPLTKKYYQSLNYGLVERLTIGESQSKFKNVWRTKNGDVTVDFRTKNPYGTDQEDAMEGFEREYLKGMLLEINRWKYGLSDKDVKNLNPDLESSIRQNKKLADALDSGDYFKMPLVRNTEYTKYKDMLSEKWRPIGYIKDEFKSWVDGRELSEYDISNIDAQKMGFFEMYDVYGRQSDEVKAKMINERGVNYYDINLDTIAHRIAYNKIRKQTFDIILPTISAYIWALKLQGGQKNKEIDKQIDYVVNQVKLAVFDEPLISGEEENLAIGISAFKKISSFSMLGFKISSLPKEIVTGTLRNFLASGSKMTNDFTQKDLIAAYTKMMTIDNKFTDEFNLIDRLNFFYRTSNMDISSMVQRLQTDRYGVMKGINKYAFLTSTLGDMWNRSAVLLAKMINDGSYEAHSLGKDGELIYDVTKDKRFSHYLKERYKYKNSEGKYTTSKTDTLYNKQRQHYLTEMNIMNQEALVVNEEQMIEEDLLEKAYSQQERDSLKAYADLMYGSYDKDAQPQILHKLFGITFLQFLQYWPSKIKLWFGKEISAEDSPIGKIEHLYREKDGKKEYMYYELVENPDGTEEKRVVYHDTGEPVFGWSGTPQEGLFIAMGRTAQALFRADWDAIKNNPYRAARVKYALGDMMFIFILLGVIAAIFNNLKEDNPKGTFSGELIHFMANVNQKILNEFKIVENTIGPMTSEPAFLSWGIGAATSLKQTIEGDRTLGQFLSQNFGAFEHLKGLD